MANGTERESVPASGSSLGKSKIDICFIGKGGKVSVGDSTQSSLASRTPTRAIDQISKSSNNPASATKSNVNSGPEGHQRTKTTSVANDANQIYSNKDKLSKSESDLDHGLHPKDFLAEGESSEPHKPDDSYFTLIWLDRFYGIIPAPKSEGKDQSNQEEQQTFGDIPKKNLRHKSFDCMDDCYIEVLESLKLCGNCKTHAQKILWRNIRECESRYEARCRTCEEQDGVCFLKCMDGMPQASLPVLTFVAVHTMQVPYLNESNFILALVHHVRIPVKPGGYGEPKEHIFAFILGLSANEISKLFNSLRCYWDTTDLDDMENVSQSSDAQDIPLTNSKRKEVGLTARLFVAAILRLYGSLVAQDKISESFGKLKLIFDMLNRIGKVKSKDKQSEDSNIENTAESVTGNDETLLKFLNLQLMQMDGALPGVRSRVHYIGLCAQGLLREQSSIQEYIKEKLGEVEPEKAEEVAKVGLSLSDRGPSTDKNCNSQANGPEEKGPSKQGNLSNQGRSLEQITRVLSSSRYKRRDDDKLDMLNRSMQQFEVDIKSLKARTNIAIGLVSAAEARLMGDYQRSIATWTVLVLPATFFGILITTPMIQWAKPVVKLASGDSDSHFDKGWPIFAAVPFFFWLLLSAFFSVPMGLNLMAKRNSMETLPFLKKKMKECPKNMVKLFRQFRPNQNTGRTSVDESRMSTMRSRKLTQTIRTEEARDTNSEASPRASTPVGASKVLGVPPTMSGARVSDESTLNNGSTADHIETEP